MNLENYDKIEHDDGRIELIPKKKNADWTPKKDEVYWYINSDGLVDSETFSFAFDADSLSNHNCYPTREVAEKAAKLMRRSNAIIRACLLVDPEFDPDWKTCRNQKWHVSRDCEAHRWGATGAYRCTNASPAYVSSDEKCNEAIDLLNKWGVE